MAQLSHQLHLFHHVPTNVLLPLERQLLDPDNGALVLGCVTIGVDAPGFSGYEAAEWLFAGAWMQATVVIL